MARKRNRNSKRRAKSKPRNPIFWSKRDRLELLAYLNWCIQYNGDFNSTSISYLQRATGKVFSERQVHGKLKREWDGWGICKTFDDLFSVGTAGLEPLVPDDQKIVEQILAEIDPPTDGHWLRSRSIGPVTRSRTLSAACSTRSTTESRACSSQQRGGKQSQRQLKQTTKSRRSARVMRTRETSEDELEKGDASDAVKKEHLVVLNTAPSPFQPDSNAVFQSAMLNLADEHMIDTPETVQAPLVETRLRDAEVEISKQKAYILTLLNRLSEAEKEIDELQRISRVADSTHEDEAKLHERIARLANQRSSHETFLRRVKALETDRLALSGKAFREELNLLYIGAYDTGDLIYQMNSNANAPGQSVDIPDYAQSWVELLYDGDFGSLVEYTEAEGIPTSKLISALLMAGVFKLVMEPALLSMSAMQSPQLDQYRRHILDQCGSRALRQLDLITVKSLLSNEEVLEDIKAETARWLSVVILPILNTFFPPGSQFNGMEMDMLKDLERTVSQAVKLKIQVMPASGRFKRMFFRPGTQFDSDIMRYDDSQASSTSSKGQKVRLCLQPAIFYESAEAASQDDEDDTLPLEPIYTRCFTDATAADELDSFSLISKAIVLV
ncbi:hypothetical protein FLAG1_08553 [Fusarium langsethiae]|uniref:Uncharacterized protein n=1 Tax=Fusarium langsethiae TaxID=179993 RepID=A0A0N0DCR4_FUSLA|nr:hypothetical protein FLAG1_08553 [Fusarium langsethiae]GKU06027.1 unnamed protein product [Fusarium langsethiae]GKU21626.1 unnamed protein product [Fusarium langsethiae]